MTPRELFDVAVRIVGVFALLWGIWDLANAALFYTDYFRSPDMTFRYYLIYGWVSIFTGLFLIRAAGILVDFAYPTGNEQDLQDAETAPKVDTDL